MRRGTLVGGEYTAFLIVVLIVVAIVASYLYVTAQRQAESQKTAINILQAKAWRIDGGVAVSLTVQNMGNTPESIRTVGIVYNASGGTYYCEWRDYYYPNVVVDPGEMKTISAVFADSQSLAGRFYGDCSYVDSVAAGTSIYVYIDTGSGEVGRAVEVEAP